MAKAKAVWGIDVGNCALKGIKLSLDPEGKIQLAAVEYIEHSKILSQPDSEPAEIISKSLEKFLSRYDITQDEVAIGVPGKHTLARFSKLPPVDPKKIPDIVHFEANQQIPFDMDEVIWDYQTFGEADSPEIEVGIFAMKHDLIHQHLAHFSDVGLEPILVQSAPLALFDAMKYDDQCSGETTAIIDVGAENTDLVITDRVRIWTRTIPVGGNAFTDALASGFKLSFAKAETLKRQASTSKYARQIFQTMRPVFADLVGEIQRSIGYYTSSHREAKLDRIIGMGNAFKLPGLQKYLEQNLSVSVIRPTKFKKIEATPSMDETLKENVLSLGVAYGLAIEGLDQGQMKNNLLPTEITRLVVWRKKRPWFAAAAACLLVSALMILARKSMDLNTLRANIGESVGAMTLATAKNTFQGGLRDDLPAREYAQKVLLVAKTFNDEYKKLETQGVTEQKQSEMVVSLFKSRDVILKILQAVHLSLPEPTPLLAEVNNGADYVKALIQHPKELARGQRTEIFFDQYESLYVDNVYALNYRPEKKEDESSKELFDYYSKQPVPGFVITLDCRTPNAERGSFVRNTFLPRLKENGQREKSGFYFDGIVLIVSPGGSGSSTGFPSVGTGRGSPSATTTRKGQDPLTREDTSEDWNFKVKFVVALKDRPAEKAPGTPETKGEGPRRAAATTSQTAPVPGEEGSGEQPVRPVRPEGAPQQPRPEGAPQQPRPEGAPATEPRDDRGGRP